MFPEKKLLKKNDKIVIFNKLKEKNRSEDFPLIVHGLTPGMSIHFAKCCNPIPGDEAISFVMKNKGLIIHLKLCKELKKKKSEDYKFIKVSWENLKYKKNDFVAKINVLIRNKIGALGVLSSIIGKSLSNIRNLEITERNTDYFKINIDIDVKNKSHLSKVIASLRTSDFIESVSRI